MVGNHTSSMEIRVLPLPIHRGEIRRADGGPPQGTAHARESHSATIDEN